MKFKNLIINSSSKIAINLLSNLVSLITLPLYLKTYGDELYGIFIVALSLNASLSLMDLGLGSALRRFTAKFTADKNYEVFGYAVSYSLTIFLIIAVINAALVFLLSYFAGAVFNLSPAYNDLSIPLFQFAAVYSIFFWITKFTKSIFEGFQLHWLFSLSTFINIFSSIAIYFFVYFSKVDFLTFCFLSFAIYILPVLVQVFFIIKMNLLKGVKIKLGIKKHDFKSEFFHISKDLFLIGLIALFSTNTDQYILSLILTPAMVTAYFVVTKPTQIIKMITNYMFVAIEPLITKEHHLGNTNIIERIKKEGTLLHFFVNTPLVFTVIILLDPFISLWIDNKYNEYVIWGQLAVLSLFFTPYFNTKNKIIINTGNPKAVRNINFYTVVLNLIISIIATYYLGLGGVIIGTLVQVIVKIPIYSIYYKKHFGSSIDLYLIKKMIPFIIATISICYFSLKILEVFSLNTWSSFILFGMGLLIALYLVGILFFFREIKALFNKKPVSSTILEP